MGEFEDKLNGILNNPQEMEKIMALARNFMGNGSPAGSVGVPPVPPPPVGQVVDSPLPSFGGGEGLDGLLGGLDPALMAKLVKGFAGGMGTAALLQSITPHLKSERQAQLKRAITMAQMLRVARSMFGSEL